MGVREAPGRSQVDQPSMNFASYKDRKAVAAALKAIYTAVDADAAELALAEFEDSDLARRYPAIAPSWRRAGAGPGTR